ncbi:MAG: hypothetical protein HC938_15495 [Nitrospira sp.]|nr:hypothetical protein [Nitrospira sp.]
MPIVQATSKVGIVIGFARFGTVPVVISLRLQQLAMVLRWWVLRYRCCGESGAAVKVMAVAE